MCALAPCYSSFTEHKNVIYIMIHMQKASLKRIVYFHHGFGNGPNSYYSTKKNHTVNRCEGIYFLCSPSFSVGRAVTAWKTSTISAKTS